jgi:hypothetical protein
MKLTKPDDHPLALKERPDVRARAALGILAAATKAEELENLTARVEALERGREPTTPTPWPKSAAIGRGSDL